MLLGKAKLAIISLLCCCALTCVGFSAWTITANEVSRTVTNGVAVENVMVSDEYIKVKSYDVFKFSDSVFFTSNDVPSTDGKGYITITFTLNAGACYQFFKSTDLRTVLILRIMKYPNGFSAAANVTESLRAELTNVEMVTTDTGITFDTISDPISESENVQYTFLTHLGTQTTGSVEFKVTYAISVRKGTFENAVFKYFDKSLENPAYFGIEARLNKAPATTE